MSTLSSERRPDPAAQPMGCCWAGSELITWVASLKFLLGSYEMFSVTLIQLFKCCGSMFLFVDGVNDT